MFVEVDVPIRVSLRALATATDKKGFIEMIAEQAKQRIIKRLTDFDIEKAQQQTDVNAAAKAGFGS